MTIGVVLVAVSTVPPPPPPRAAPPATTPDRRADRRRDRGDPNGPGLEDHPAEQDLAGRREPKRALPSLDRRFRGRRIVVGLRQPVQTEVDQGGGQLTHVGAVGHAEIEGPVGGDGSVEQRHRHIAHRVDGLVLLDDVAHVGQRGVGGARVRGVLLRQRQCSLVSLQRRLVGLRPWPGSGRGRGLRAFNGAWSSRVTKLLADWLYICSRLGAALLNVAAVAGGPQKPGWRDDDLDLRVTNPMKWPVSALCIRCAALCAPCGAMIHVLS